MWQIKATADGVKAFLPAQSRLRALVRHVRPYRPEPDKITFTIRQGFDQLRLLRANGAKLDGVTVELGAGWFPVMPLIHLAAGARCVIMIDIERLMDQDTIDAASKAVAARACELAALLDIPVEIVRQRLACSDKLDYRAPFDIRSLPDQSVDLIMSRAVLEHLPPDAIEPLLVDAQRFMAPGGAMIHTIDNSDHFAHQDSSIGLLNFLRYRESVWKWTGINPQTYTNRLRHDDYLRLMAKHDFEVVATIAEPHPKALEDLRTLPLAPQFAAKSMDMLAVVESVILARPTTHQCEPKTGHQCEPKTGH